LATVTSVTMLTFCNMTDSECVKAMLCEREGEGGGVVLCPFSVVLMGMLNFIVVFQFHTYKLTKWTYHIYCVIAFYITLPLQMTYWFTLMIIDGKDGL